MTVRARPAGHRAHFVRIERQRRRPNHRRSLAPRCEPPRHPANDRATAGYAPLSGAGHRPPCSGFDLRERSNVTAFDASNGRFAVTVLRLLDYNLGRRFNTTSANLRRPTEPRAYPTSAGDQRHMPVNSALKSAGAQVRELAKVTVLLLASRNGGRGSPGSRAAEGQAAGCRSATASLANVPVSGCARPPACSFRYAVCVHAPSGVPARRSSARSRPRIVCGATHQRNPPPLAAPRRRARRGGRLRPLPGPPGRASR